LGLKPEVKHKARKAKRSSKTVLVDRLTTAKETQEPLSMRQKLMAELHACITEDALLQPLEASVHCIAPFPIFKQLDFEHKISIMGSVTKEQP
jgi:hypothetical protein